MAEMRVWAPDAGLVELESAGSRVKMDRTENGWWTVDAPFIRHGVDYAYYVDGEGPLPDPRSAWQPEGVHGPSRWVEHSRFTWTDAGWQQPPLGSAVIYELHVGTFTPEGTFDSAIGRLDHLVELGITHVELMPVAEFSGLRGWGYDGVDLYAPHHAYGGPDGLKRLVDACHKRGLAVMLDVVYNHLGPCGNYLQRFGPYFTALPDTLGRSGQSGRAGERRGAEVLDRQRPHVAAGLSLRRPSHRRHPCHHRYFRHPFSRAARRGGGRSRSRTRPSSRSHCRERSERSPRHTLTRTGRLRDRCPVERRLSPRSAFGAHGRAGRLLP